MKQAMTTRRVRTTASVPDESSSKTSPRTTGEGTTRSRTTREAGPAMDHGFKGYPPPLYASTRFALDPRVVLDEIVRCGRGLQIVADEIDLPDKARREKAKLAGMRYFFYALGLFHSAGVVLSPLITLVEPTTSASPSEVCRGAGKAIERYILDQFGGRSPYGGDTRDLVESLGRCFCLLTAGTHL